jgi:hypothetical protein
MRGDCDKMELQGMARQVSASHSKGEPTNLEWERR